MNGLAAYLGVPARIGSLDGKLKKQNPEPLESKVENFAAMEQALARLDRFNLSRTPNFEPRRGPVIPTYIAGKSAPLLYLPIRSGPEAAVLDWMAAIDGCAPDDLVRGFTQKTLRQWKRKTKGHRSFTVVRHPLARAHAAFCDLILTTGPGTYPEVRENLRKFFKIPIPKGAPDESYSIDQHRAAFMGFLGFLKANLASQTGIRVDPNWATQATILQGFADFAQPDMVIHEDRMRIDLAYLALTIGRDEAADMPKLTDPHAARLESIYDEELERAATDAYQRDYMAFGFDTWR